MLPNEYKIIDRPDILIFEGLNVLQPGRLAKDGRAIAFVSDFFDFSIYIDADVKAIEKWYLSRFHQLFTSAFTNPKSYFHSLTLELNEEQAIDRAQRFWREINLPNLRENIEPTRSRATLVMQKGDDRSLIMASE